MKKFYTADKETGTFIEEFDTYAEAVEAIEQYEAEDKAEGTYEDNFYDVVNEDHCSYLYGCYKQDDKPVRYQVRVESQMSGGPLSAWFPKAQSWFDTELEAYMQALNFDHMVRERSCNGAFVYVKKI